MSRLALCLALLFAAPGAGRAQPAPEQLRRAIAESSAATDLPQDLLLRVIAAESGGRPRAVSPAGALGLMQLMPATWAELRAHLHLGPDPFDIRDNVFAGAAYLREMLDRFGAQGFIAAYNLGPNRYARRMAAGRALPAETLGYVRRVARGGPAAPHAAPHAGLIPSDAGLFAVRSSP